METSPPSTDQPDEKLAVAAHEVVSERRYRPGAIIRDVVIIMALTGFAWILVNNTTSVAVKVFNPAKLERDLALANVLAATLGFTISGSLAKQYRWRHLIVVTLIVWCITLINILLLQYPISAGLIMLPVLLVFMSIGGMLSYLFNRSTVTTDSAHLYNLKTIIRDVVIVLGMTILGGFVIGYANPDALNLYNQQKFQNQAALAALIMMTIGFMISGSLAKQNRWRQLGAVSTVVWLLLLITVVTGQNSLGTWLIGLLPIEMCMGVGGSFSYLFNRP